MVNTILVIEDDKDLREYLETFLADSGFRVLAASTGSESLKLIDKVRPDLTVLDLGLPDIDGETVCKEVKKNIS